MAQSNLDILINATDNASPALRSVGSAAMELNSGVSSMAGVMQGLAATAMVTMAASAARATVDLAAMAGRSQMVEAAFRQMAGAASQNADDMLSALQRASNGTVDAYDLMLAANRSMTLGVTSSTSELAGLMQFASQRARALGMDTGQAFDDLVVGIGRNSPKILDNLGISLTDIEKAQTAYAASVNKTVKELNDQDQKQALVNATLAAAKSGLANMPADTNNAAIAVMQLNAAWDDFKVAIGETLGPDITSALQGVTSVINTAKEHIGEIKAMLGDLSPMLTALFMYNKMAMDTGGKVGQFATGLFATSPADAARARVEQAQAAYDLLQRQIDAQNENLRLTSGTPQFQLGNENLAAAGYARMDTSTGQSQLDALQLKAQAARQELESAKTALDNLMRPSWDGVAKWMTGPSQGVAAKALGLSPDDIQKLVDSAMSQVAGLGARMAQALPGFNQEGFYENQRAKLEEQLRLWSASGMAVDEIKNVKLRGYLDGLSQIVTQQEAITRGWENLNQRGADMLTGVAQKIASAIGGQQGADVASAYYARMLPQLDAMIEKWRAQGRTVGQIANYDLPQYVAGLEKSVSAATALNGVFGAMPGVVANVLAGLSQIPGVLGAAVSAANTLTSAVGAVTGGLVRALGVMSEQRSAWAQSQALGLLASGAQVDAQKALNYTQDQYNQAFQKTLDFFDGRNYSEEQFAFQLKANLQTLGATNDEANKLANKLDAAATSTGGISDKFGDIKSKVSGVLQSALGNIGGADPSKVLPYKDEPSENAKRLGAIMNEGLINQPWMEQFKKEVPGVFDELVKSGDVRQKAAEILRDFQQGLRPELINKETVKERVKAMITGETNMANLANEIAGELSKELNISMPQALAQTKTALGIGGPAMGATASLSGGVQQGADGGQIVQGVIVKMEASYALVQKSGATAGKMWGTGFMGTVESGIAQPLIQLLVTLVTPGVMAAIAKQNSLQGAQ